ncbi:MerR family transcriptional regulator [Clostridium sp. MT-14]|uniref:MerR family transcriptional regulator n=1 Tax=Clostridium aromativorans TaxID=2836848 RepID=A0ABS8N9B0_9CLOT|nr:MULTISPECIES: MerR family transcriptional regulator [Clostridium]KAA8675464.1 MerR family transcriptional regulator [Clostridium sp. HV4-5-A1G]MCC9296383.1 MerR family transcriptional regulator [Clostridium aromativorans]CAB1262088.1 HTH merR-type domain-containing protein [Clostridiaceae bacterium BL-3]
MDNKDKYIDTQKVDHRIQNKKRGEILYYSIDQVANLLNENINNIKYYTNIFDDLLKIQIVDKELRYTDADIDKLEFLIKLKNRGMSLKEIQDYYSKLPLNDNEVQHPGSNLLSVEELIDSIKEEQRIQFDNFKIQLNDDIQKVNLLYIKNITSAIIEAQNKSLDKFKQDLFEEIKEYLNSKFDKIDEINLDLHNQFIDKMTKFISKKIDSKNDELKLNLQDNFNGFFQSCLTNSEHLIKEVKGFKKVIKDAYYTQYQVEMDNANKGFLNKLFQIFKFR